MQIVPGTFPLQGADTVTPLDSSHCASLKANRIDFVMRYLGGLSAVELKTILASGLKLGLVTFSRAAGWIPTAELGAQDAAKDLLHLAELGIPKGARVWLDLEGSGGGQQASWDWADARSAAIVAAGYKAGLYVGGGGMIDAQHLYSLPHIDGYWKSLSHVPEPQCGWCMIQLYKSITIGSVYVDVNVVQYDYKDRLPSFLAA